MDKRTTEREAVSELRDGMTIGIGGWGSRRKPMSIVREILRSSVKDLTVVTYGGPDVGLLCNAGKIKRLVYGCANPKAGAVTTLYQLVSDPRLNHRIDVTAGVRADECTRVLQEFFAALRRGPSYK